MNTTQLITGYGQTCYMATCTRATLVFAACFAILCPELRQASGAVNLEWRPQHVEVDAGEVVEIGLYAVSDQPTTQSHSGLDLAFAWETYEPVSGTGYLTLLEVVDSPELAIWLSGFLADPYGLNEADPPQDGDGLYQILAGLGQTLPAEPDGTLMATFRFQAEQGVALTTITMLADYTEVWHPTIPNLPVTGTLADATVTIVGGPDVTPPELVSAASRREHGTVGTFDVPLPLSPVEESGTEPRVGGVSQLVLAFSENIAASDGTLNCSEISLSSGQCLSVNPGGSTLEVMTQGVPDESCLQVSLSGIEDLAGNPLTGDSDVHVIVLQGDVSTPLAFVDIQDLSIIKQNLFLEADASRFRSDVNASGFIDINDLSVTKSRLFKSASCP